MAQTMHNLVSIKLTENLEGCTERHSVPKSNKENNAESCMSIRYSTRQRDVLVISAVSLRCKCFPTLLTLLTMRYPNKHLKIDLHNAISKS